MTQVKNVLQTAALSRRVVCRALTVVGGAAAGTALAWALSSASASAEVPTLVGDVSATVQEITSPVTEPVDAVARNLQEPAPPEASLADLRDQVREAFHTETLPELPACTVCAEPRDYLTDSVSRSDVPTASAVLVPTPSATVPNVVEAVTVPVTAKERAFTGGMSRRAGPELSQPARPDVPGWPARLPITPAGIPTAGSQAPTGNVTDSQLFAALPWQDSGTDLVARGMAAAADATTSGRPGAQPGVAPD
ncbi:hypothetical protein [Actinophytocola sp.]|uniref:hypothetical protein n=1 Tax=Actinophytocola sp. TaxID=1872138 RepID=UPI002ED1E25B